MSAPVLSLSLLTPTSVRLSWTYTAYYGDAIFDVWWKSDHPAGQDFVLHGRTADLTYDVTGLSWTTTYTFRIMAIVGAWPDGEYSNEIEIFVCCGQGVATPAFNYWQQAVDPDFGLVAFVSKEDSNTNIYYYDWESSVYYWHGRDTETYVDGDSSMPVSVRKVGNITAILDIIGGPASIFGYTSSHYRFLLWEQGVSQDFTRKDLYFGVTSEPVVPPFVNISSFGSAVSMEFNGERVVVASLYDKYLTVSPTTYSGAYVTIRVSEDRGVTWGNEIEIASSAARINEMNFFAGSAICMTEAEDGSIWITYKTSDPEVIVTTATAIFKLYKWTQADGVSLIKTITTLITNAYTEISPYSLNYMLGGAYANIYAEGTKIVHAYTNDIDIAESEVLNTPGERVGTASVMVDVSNDTGSTWNLREIILPDTATIAWITDGIENILPCVCIASGNIIMYLHVGSTNANKQPVIIRSTDDGATWSIVYTFPNYSTTLPYIFVMRSNGDHVAITGCGVALRAENEKALWESFDAGATWTEVETTFALNILVPTSPVLATPSYPAAPPSDIPADPGTAPDIGGPNAPTSIVSDSVSISQIDLTWVDTSSDEDGFAIYRGLSRGSVTDMIATVAPGVTTYSDTGLPSSTWFYYTVRSFNSSGYSSISGHAWSQTWDEITAWSNISEFTIVVPILYLDIIWGAIDGALTYQVQVSTDSIFSDVIFAIETAELTVRVDAAVGTYYWRYRGVRV
jgi:hypothetical protein